jgi:type I restriction enzyme R subunit
MSSEDMFKTPPAQSEYVTRKQIVDRRLRDAGWKIVRFDETRALAAYERCAIEEYPTENGPADYALCVGSKILGIVEAKKLTLGPQNVLMQAERYSKGLLASPFNFRSFRVPFLYSTNDEVIWHHDVRHELNRSREIQGFHTPDALIECFARDFEGALAKLAILPNDHPRIVARPYHVEANTAIEKAIEARKRQMLLAIATGTGKTFNFLLDAGGGNNAPTSKNVTWSLDRASRNPILGHSTVDTHCPIRLEDCSS